jgi:hypothetical protein
MRALAFIRLQFNFNLIVGLIYTQQAEHLLLGKFAIFITPQIRSCKMAITYEEYTNINNEKYLIKTNNDGVQSWVPCDSTNSDYQAYLNKDNPDWNKPTL